jgi:hypothetical protein
MDNVQSSYYNTWLSETNLLNHDDVHGAILRKNLCNNISNSQFVMNLKCHHTPLSVKKLLVVRDAKVTQAMLVCPIKNIAEWEKTNDRYTSHISSLSFQDTWSTYIPQQYKIFLHYSTYMGFAKICNYISAQCTNDLEHNVS